jgi:hypothetical protein
MTFPNPIITTNALGVYLGWQLQTAIPKQCHRQPIRVDDLTSDIQPFLLALWI